MQTQEIINTFICGHKKDAAHAFAALPADQQYETFKELLNGPANRKIGEDNLLRFLFTLTRKGTFRVGEPTYLPLNDERTPHVIALRFSAILRTWLSFADMQDILVKNEKEGNDRSVCHSHDHCDANEAMAEAFQEVTGTEVDVQEDKHTAVWNYAWDIAKAAHFYPRYTGETIRTLEACRVAMNTVEKTPLLGSPEGCGDTYDVATKIRRTREGMMK